MIKNLLKKIKEFLFKSKKEQNERTECPYKIEPKAEEEIKEEKADDILTCEHCKEELHGKVSDKDETGAYYIWCRKCNYVNKLKDGKVIRKANNAQEVMKAFKLFKDAGHTPNSYSVAEKSDRCSFK